MSCPLLERNANANTTLRHWQKLIAKNSRKTVKETVEEEECGARDSSGRQAGKQSAAGVGTGARRRIILHKIK